jgi:hypothetical protein
MRTAHRALLAVAVVLPWGLCCLAQSNADSQLPSGSGPLTGYRVATVSYSPVWEISSPPNSCRILRGDYWTDSAGHPIPLSGRKPRGPGDKHRRFTRVLLGPVSFSMPLSPSAAGVVGAFLALLLGLVALTCVTWRGRCDDEKPARL